MIASSVAYALNNPDDGSSQEWLELTEDMIAAPVWPEFRHIDLSLEGPAMNSVVLCELHERSIRGEDLLDGLQEFILAAKLDYRSARSTRR